MHRFKDFAFDRRIFKQFFYNTFPLRRFWSPQIESKSIFTITGPIHLLQYGTQSSKPWNGMKFLKFDTAIETIAMKINKIRK